MTRKQAFPKPPDRRLKEPLTIRQILAWADRYHARTGAWPRANSGRIREARGTTWCAVDAALRTKIRGLTFYSSLAQLLRARRGVRNQQDLPPLTTEQILGWGDAYFAAAGRWPDERSGPIPDSEGETWRTVAETLQAGKRGLRRSTLPKLFAKHRGRRNHMALRPLTTKKVLRWADAHFRRTGAWPKHNSGSVVTAPGETWSAVNAALWAGCRGLPGGSSLTKLLMERRGLRSCGHRPPLTIPQILRWADAYERRYGRRPTKLSGNIPDSDDDTWIAVEMALRKGSRGLPGGSSLYRLLTQDPPQTAARCEEKDVAIRRDA